MQTSTKTSSKTASKTSSKTLIDLETRFWQSMVDHDTDAAIEMLSEPSLMISAQGPIKFDHASYRQMADQGKMVITSFELSDVDVVFPNDTTAIVTYHVKQAMAPRGSNDSTMQEMHDTSTWIRNGKDWQCVMHTETPMDFERSAH